MPYKLVTEPASEPVSLTEAKRHLRVDYTDDDDLIAIFIKAARQHAETYTGRAFIDQTWELTLDEFPDNEIQILKPPLIEVESVKYDDAAGDEQTLSDGLDYTVDLASEPGWIVPTDQTWPTTFDGINAVRVRFRAGYVGGSPEAETVPNDLKAAILLYVGTLYANRETVVIGAATKLPWASEQLLRLHRFHLGIA